MDFRLIVRNSKKLNHGFTLLELVISVSIFSLVVVAAVGIMISVFAAQAKAVAVKNVLDNARFSLELMTREMRTGSDIKYTADPPSGCPRNGLEFTSYNQGSPQERFYYLEDTDGDTRPDAIMRVAMPSAGNVDCSAVPPQQFTSEEIIIDSWKLQLRGNAIGPTDGQPRVTLGFVMHSRDSRFGTQTRIDVQTTIVPRLRDL